MPKAAREDCFHGMLHVLNISQQNVSWYDGKRQHTGQQVPNQYKIVFLLKNSTKSVYFGEIAKKQYGTVKTVRNGSTGVCVSKAECVAG